MDNNYSDFQGTEAGLDAETDDLEWEDEQNDLLPILGLSALFASIVGGILMLVGRRHKPTPQEQAQEALESVAEAGKKGARKAAEAVAGLQLGDLLSEAIGKARDAAGSIDVGEMAGAASDKAGEAFKAAGLAALLSGAADQAGERIGKLELDKKAKGLGKKASKAAQAFTERLPEVDTKAAGNVLDTLRERITDAIDSVRTDIAPAAVEKLKSDVLPAAQGAVEAVAGAVREQVVPAAQDVAQKVREDVLPAAQERAGHLADEWQVEHRAKKVASAATQGAGSVRDMGRVLAVAVMKKVAEELIPELKKMGARASTTAREDVAPAVAETAGKAAGAVGDFIPKVGEAAAQTPDMLSGLLKAARDRAAAAAEKAGPVAADAATFARHRAGEAATFTKHRAGDVASVVGDRRNGTSKVVAKAGKDAKKAAAKAGKSTGGIFGATSRLTREATRIVFWLGALGGLILLVFVPERERQKEIIDNVVQLLGELREMWNDLQGTAYSGAGSQEGESGQVS